MSPVAAVFHRLIACCAALAVALGGGVLLALPTLREWWGPAGEIRSPPGEAAPPDLRNELIHLAFLGPDGRTLEEEGREVMLPRSAVAAAGIVLAELRGGSRQGRGAVLPPGAQVRRVFVDKRGVAYVDFSAELLAPPASESRGAGQGAGDPKPAAEGPGPGPRPPAAADAWAPVARAAQAAAASLGMSLPEIAQVQVLAEGREILAVADGVDLRRPLPASLPSRAAAPSP